GERVAEIRRKPDLRRGILGRLLAHLGEAALEKLDGALRPAERRVGTSERREDVRVCQRRDGAFRERDLQLDDCLVVVPAARGGLPDREPCAEYALVIPGLARLVQERTELFGGGFGILLEPQPDLRLRESKVAGV